MFNLKKKKLCLISCQTFFKFIMKSFLVFKICQKSRHIYKIYEKCHGCDNFLKIERHAGSNDWKCMCIFFSKVSQ